MEDPREADRPELDGPPAGQLDDADTEQLEGPAYAPTALPSTLARVLAFGSILLAGLCGGLIGYAVVDLQCEGDCTAVAGTGGVAGAVVFAAGVGVVAVLALRATAEWRTVQARDADPDR